jgi:hypothetical protein
MNTPHTLKRIIGGALLSGGVVVAGLGLAAGTAQAHPSPAPLYPGPLPTDNGDWGPPHHWCPGQPLPDTGNRVTDPLRWDMTICHTYYYTYPLGNVARTIWDGDNPPPKPPPPVGLYCEPNLTNCRIGTHP